jgi:putative ABC transport system permease protein
MARCAKCWRRQRGAQAESKNFLDTDICLCFEQRHAMAQMAFKMALKSIAASKTRSALTMLGIIVGVLALVVLVSLVDSATESVTRSIQSMGQDMLMIRVRDDKGSPLKLEDVEQLARRGAIALACPAASAPARAKAGANEHAVSMEAATPSLFQIQGMEPLAGRLLKTADLENGTYAAVLSYELAAEAFGEGHNPVGESITLSGARFEVVGVLKEDNSMSRGWQSSNAAYIPFTVAGRLEPSVKSVSSFYATAAGADRMEEAIQEVRSFLLGRFRSDEDSFTLMNMDTLAATLDSVSGVFSWLLGGIAAISLLVGGIGIMNIMLVSVMERTKEIGVRKAIGAPSSSILAQFLLESLIVCLIGCAAGVALSAAILFLVNRMAGDDVLAFRLSGQVVLVAVAFSTAIGLAFGLYPARKAAKMQPIDALRYE